MNLQFIATIISRIFDPFIMFGATIVLLFGGTTQIYPAILIYFVLPLLLFIIAWKTKIISNWDVTDRKERPKLLWTMLVIEILGTIFFRLHSMYPYLLMFVGFVIVTQFWKISGHTFASATFAGIVIQTLGLGWWPVLSIPFLVGWSRVYRKNHTLAQAIAGGIYPLLSLYILNIVN